MVKSTNNILFNISLNNNKTLSNSFYYVLSYNKLSIDLGWIYLVIAGLFEVSFTTCLKMSNNFQNKWWGLAFLITSILSFVFLNRAIQTIPMGTAYAVWTGIGATGTAIVGMTLFSESTEFWRIFFLFLLISSIIGLKFVSAE